VAQPIVFRIGEDAVDQFAEARRRIQASACAHDIAERVDRVLDDFRQRIDEIAQVLAASPGPSSTRDGCIEAIAAGAGESAFRGAVELPEGDFLAVCGEGRLLGCLGDKQLSEPTVLDVAARLVAVFPSAPAQIAPILLAALLYFDPENEFVASYLKAALGGIVAAVAAMDDSPDRDIELLTMVAQSFRVSSLD
jgi:hypothetical protein